MRFRKTTLFHTDAILSAYHESFTLPVEKRTKFPNSDS